MTAEEKKAYNNGFILGMASKGVIKISSSVVDSSDNGVFSYEPTSPPPSFIEKVFTRNVDNFNTDMHLIMLDIAEWLEQFGWVVYSTDFTFAYQRIVVLYNHALGLYLRILNGASGSAVRTLTFQVSLNSDMSNPTTLVYSLYVNGGTGNILSLYMSAIVNHNKSVAYGAKSYNRVDDGLIVFNFATLRGENDEVVIFVGSGAFLVNVGGVLGSIGNNVTVGNNNIRCSSGNVLLVDTYPAKSVGGYVYEYTDLKILDLKSTWNSSDSADLAIFNKPSFLLINNKVWFVLSNRIIMEC